MYLYRIEVVVYGFRISSPKNSSAEGQGTAYHSSHDSVIDSKMPVIYFLDLYRKIQKKAKYSVMN